MKRTDLIKFAETQLKDAGIPDYEESSRRLLSFVLKCKDGELFLKDNISEDDNNNYLKLIKERSRHVPLDKIIGFKYFYDIKIPFNKNVLTPRYETEFLVDRVVIDIKNMYSNVRLNLPFSPITVLDLCTGSGCVGLAVANSTGANVTLSDIDKLALSVASSNNDLNNKIREERGLPPINPNFVLSDMFDSIKWKFDIIVCNPPYICSQDLNKLEIEVRDFDPAIALDGGKDGLNFYRTIAKVGHKYLNDAGRIYLEIGINQSEKIVKLLEKNFDNIEVIKDLAGIDRFIIARKRDKHAK